MMPPVSSYLCLAGDILTFYTGCDAHRFARVCKKARFCTYIGSGTNQRILHICYCTQPFSLADAFYFGDLLWGQIKGCVRFISTAILTVKLSSQEMEKERRVVLRQLSDVQWFLRDQTLYSFGMRYLPKLLESLFSHRYFTENLILFHSQLGNILKSYYLSGLQKIPAQTATVANRREHSSTTLALISLTGAKMRHKGLQIQ